MYATRRTPSSCIRASPRNSFPKWRGRLGDSGCELRCDRRARSIIGNSNGVTIASATDEDWGTEFLALTAAIKWSTAPSTRRSTHRAGTCSGHTDVIVTRRLVLAALPQRGRFGRCPGERQLAVQRRRTAWSGSRGCDQHEQAACPRPSGSERANVVQVDGGRLRPGPQLAAKHSLNT